MITSGMQRGMRDWLRRANRSAKERRSRKAAQVARLTLEAQVGALPSSERRSIERYAQGRMGSRRFAPWIGVYTLLRGEFKEGWLSEEFFRYRLLPLLNRPETTSISNVKSLTASICGTDHVPDLARRVSGIWFKFNGEVVARQRVKEAVFARTERVCIKADFRDRGRGVSMAGADEFDEIVDGTHDDLVIQRAIRQHPVVERLSPGAVATLRVVTCIGRSGDVGVRGSYLRLGRGGAQYVSAAGNQIKVGVVDETGRLLPWAADERWGIHHRHPDTGVEFDVGVPSYTGAKDLAIRLHLRVPQFRWIGWDFAIDDTGKLWLLEWNTVFPAFSFVEAVCGPVLADWPEAV